MTPPKGRSLPIPNKPTRHEPSSRKCLGQISRYFWLLTVALIGVHSSENAAAQDLMAPVVNAPSGVDSIPGSQTGGRNLGAGEVDIFDGLSYGLGTSIYYDSNIFQGDNALLGPVVGDTIMLIQPYVAYENPGGDFTFGGRFSLDQSIYFSDSDLGALGYAGSVNVGYEGGKIRFTGNFDSSLSNGTNRDFNNQFIETLNFNTGLGLNYALSPKTSIDSRFNYSWTEPSGAGLAATNNTGFDTAALWKYSKLTTFGPGIAWTQQGGDRQPDRTTIGPILRINYRLAQKVALDGTFGLDFVDSGAGGDDTAFSTSLGVNYQASRLWGMNLSVFKGTRANGGAGSPFNDTFSVRTGYTHKIRRAQLNLGVGYEVTSSVGVGAALTPDRDYLNFDTSVGMPVFWNRASATLFYTWRQETGGREYDGHRFGLSLSADF